MYKKVCGIDEVGRGALAGPLVAAGVILPPGLAAKIRQSKLVIKDSKQLTRAQREQVAEYVRDCQIPLLIKKVSVKTINKRGIGWANKQAFRSIINTLEADEYICDGNLRLGRFRKQQPIVSRVKADATELSVTLAGIIAKVYRDSLMQKLHQLFPYYGWQTNVGYGTKAHLLSLKEKGASQHHRTIFVATALQKVAVK